MLKKLVAAAVATAVVAAPVAAAPATAAANPAQALSLSSARAGSATAKTQKLSNAGIIVMALIGAGAISAFIIKEFDNKPVSP